MREQKINERLNNIIGYSEQVKEIRNDIDNGEATFSEIDSQTQLVDLIIKEAKELNEIL